jgi:hypothetical protein
MIYKSKSEINNKCKEIDNNNEISNTNDGINNYKHPSKKSFEKNQTETDPPPSVDLNKKFSLAQKEIVHRTVSSDGYLGPFYIFCTHLNIFAIFSAKFFFHQRFQSFFSIFHL